MSSLAPPVFAPADDRHIGLLMPVMHASFDPLWGEAWNESQLASAMIMQGCFARRAVDERGDTIGFTLCRAVSFSASEVCGGEAELLLIGVAPVARGHGLGRALLAQAKLDSRHRGMSEMFLEVRESNSAAFGLYRSSGFNEVGRRKGYYVGSNGTRHDAITMRCTILS